MSLPCSVKIIQSDGFDFQLYIFKISSSLFSIGMRQKEKKNTGLLF